MSQNDNQKEVQELAVRLCKLYREKKNDQMTDEELFSDGELLELRNELIDKIMVLLKDNGDLNDKWYKACHYVIMTIPRYHFNASEGEHSEFTHLFMKYYYNNYDCIERLGDEEEQLYYIRRNLGGNSEDIRRLQRIMKYCKHNNIDTETMTEEDYENIKKALPNFSIAMIRRLISIENSFAKMGSWDVMLEKNSSDIPGTEFDYSEDKASDILEFMEMLGTLTDECLKQNQREIVKCIYTNRFAGEMRDYTKKDLKEKYEKDTPEEERQSIRAQYLEDQFLPSRDKIYEQVLHLGYLSYVLQDPVPDCIYRVCLNPYRVDENGERHFTDESVERFKGMSKGNIKKTYRPKVDEILHLLKEYCRECSK